MTFLVLPENHNFAPSASFRSNRSSIKLMEPRCQDKYLYGMKLELDNVLQYTVIFSITQEQLLVLEKVLFRQAMCTFL